MTCGHRTRIQLTAAAVTPPAERAARRPAGEADATAADAGVRLSVVERGDYSERAPKPIRTGRNVVREEMACLHRRAVCASL